jgi:microcystin degradation protein MlrC
MFPRTKPNKIMSPSTSSTSHGKTNNTHLPEGGVKVRYSSIRGMIKDQGIMYQVHIENKDEPVHVSKAKHPMPANFRDVFQDALKKAESMDNQKKQPTGTAYKDLEDSESW